MRAAESPFRTKGFGVFEVDLRAAELRKHGVRIKLQEQPFQILSLLLEHPGEVVTREELRGKLWPAHTLAAAISIPSSPYAPLESQRRAWRHALPDE